MPAAPLPLPPPAPTALGRDFVLTCLAMFLQGLAMFLVMPVMPLLVVGPLGRGEAGVGAIMGLVSVAALTARPFGGYLLDRFGRRTPLLVTSILLALASVGYLVAGSFGGFLGVRILIGLGWGVTSVAAATVAADLVPQRLRGFGMGLYGVVLPLALSCGPLIGTWLLEGDRFDRVFLGSTVLSFAAVVLFIFVRVPTIRNTEVRLRLLSLVEPRVYRLFWFMLPLCIGYGGWNAFAPLYAKQEGFASVGLLYSVYAVGSLAPRIVGGRWYDRQGPRLPALTGVAIVLVGWLLLGFLGSRTGAIAGASLVGLGFGTLMPTFNAMAMDLVPADRRGAANATVFSSFDIGSAVGSFAAGSLVDPEHLASIFVVAAVLTAGAMVAFATWVLPHFTTHRIVESDASTP